MEKMATRDAYGKALVRLGQAREDIVVLDADLAKSTKTIDFAKEFPDRFFDMGIAEQNMMGTAAGLALGGKVPFASSFAVFATGRAFEQIRNSIAYPKLNVKIAASHAGVTVGEDGGSHQAVEDISLMRSIPNMTVLVPADGTETIKAVAAAAEHDGPVYIRLGRAGVPILFGDDYEFEIGKGVMLRTGTDAAIIAAGIMVWEALQAADTLQEMGLKVSVINMPSIKPIDRELIVTAARTAGCVVTAEEHSIIGGLGSAVAEVLAEEFPVPLVRVGVQDVFGESGTPGELMEHFGLTSGHIVQAVQKVREKKAAR